MSIPRREDKPASRASAANRERKSPLDLLNEALGRKDAALLEFIPLEKVEYVEFQGQDCGRLLGHKIRVGTIEDEDRTGQALWAYMSNEVRAEGLPDLCFYGSHPTRGEFCRQWNSDMVISKAVLREEFKFWSKKNKVLPIVLKACFILKGAELPLNLNFKEHFLSTLIRSCRRYKGDSAVDLGLTPISHRQPLDVQPISPSSPKHRPIMRKSEQRSRSHQTYDALTAKLTSSAPPDAFAAEGPTSVSLISRAHKHESVSEVDRVFPEPQSAKDELQISMLKMVRRDAGISRTSVGTDYKKTQSPTPDPRLSRKAPNESPISLPAVAAPHSIDHKPRTNVPDMMLKTPTGPASMKGLDAFLEAHNEIQEIEEEITSIRSDVSSMDGAYHKRRTAMKHHIDVEVTERQSKEREEQRRLFQLFVDEQKKEIHDLKGKYADLKREQAHATGKLRQLQQIKMAHVEELRRDLEKKREGLSKEQLLDFFVAQQETTKKRKHEDSQD